VAWRRKDVIPWDVCKEGTSYERRVQLEKGRTVSSQSASIGNEKKNESKRCKGRNYVDRRGKQPQQRAREKCLDFIDFRKGTLKFLDDLKEMEEG